MIVMVIIISRKFENLIDKSREFEPVNYPHLKAGGMSREGCEQLVDKEA